VLLERFSLRKKQADECICVKCKQTKPPISIAKVDAAQFLKNADLNRGISQITSMLAEVTRTTSYDAVAVGKHARASGFLRESTRSNSVAYRVVPFDDIRCFLFLATTGNHFCVGKEVIERLQGYPMGGSLSEPATLVDLQYDLRRVWAERQYRIDTGWGVPGFEIPQAVAGLQHVDDSIMTCRFLCASCMLACLQATWPADVGISLEDSGPLVRFLSAFVFAGDDRLVFAPYHPNIRFSLGFDPMQHTARLGKFLGPAIHSYEHLDRFLQG